MTHRILARSSRRWHGSGCGGCRRPIRCCRLIGCVCNRRGILLLTFGILPLLELGERRLLSRAVQLVERIDLHSEDLLLLLRRGGLALLWRCGLSLLGVGRLLRERSLLSSCAQIAQLDQERRVSPDASDVLVLHNRDGDRQVRVGTIRVGDHASRSNMPDDRAHDHEMNAADIHSECRSRSQGCSQTEHRGTVRQALRQGGAEED
eukprot:3857040-Prymnesium_polylepis.2